MDRVEAIHIIAEHEANVLLINKREEIVISWWGIDNEDDEFKVLPDQLQIELTENDEPIYPMTDVRYNPLIIQAITHDFEGVSNEYISKEIYRIQGEWHEIQGEYEKLAVCPCCKYHTLKGRGQYYICPVCFWEDDGSNEANKLSHANGMTLEEGKDNFKKLGAVLAKFIPLIKTDIIDRYFQEQK